MTQPSRRARARRVAQGIAIAAAAALVVTSAPVSTSAASAAPAPAAAPDSLWTPTVHRPQPSLDGHQRRVNPREFKAYTLDGSGLGAALERAPQEGAGAPTTLSIPAPNGELVSFQVAESPVMEPGLAAANPGIKTYAGRSADGTATVRFDVTPMGFHAFVRGARGGGEWFVDPAYNGDDSVYLSYDGDSLPVPERGLVEPDLDELAAESGLAPAPPGAGEAPGAAVALRTYRLALVTDPGYATYFGCGAVTTAQCDDIVLAEKVTLMNRVNEVYNDDLAIRMVLIDETDELNLDTAAEATGANGPCGATACFTPSQLTGCGGATLRATRIALGQLVGADRFDIGHLALGVNGGGVASLGVVGGNAKAQGCTGIPTPEGDYYAIDYVAHEMGHQFSGNHTFNGNQYNCASGNRNAETSVEPGSGSSIMAYAGICQQDNLQPHSDPYFSQRSQSEITTYVTSTRPAIDEVQTVSLYAFDASDTFTLVFQDQSTAPITAGAGYTAAAVDAALEALPSIGPGGVTVTAYGGSTTPAAFGANGFQVAFTGPTLAGQDQPLLVLNPTSGDVTGFVGTTAQGGPIQNGGSLVQPSANRAPAVSAPVDKAIPLRTPFTLTGSGSDVDGDSLVYLWEQNDEGATDPGVDPTLNGGTSLVSNTKTNGPLFRVFGAYANVTPAGTVQYRSPGENLADGNPSRTFPDMAQVLANNTNADTGTCPAAPPAPATGGGTNVPVPVIECFAEFLPTTAYTGVPEAGNTEPSLNFRLTGRDLDPQAGGYSFDDTKLLLDKGAGPFLVSSRNTATAGAAVGTRSENVLWSVANTNGYTDPGGVVHAPLATQVRISLSTDGGQSFPYVLADRVPNDGTQLVTWPNVATDQARLKVEAVDNYFFDVNNFNFAIVARPGSAPAPQTTITSGPADGGYLLATSTTVGFAADQPGATFTCTLDGAAVPCSGSSVALSGLTAGTHTFSVAATSGGTADASPATVRFTVPVDDRALAAKGRWKRTADDRAFLDTVSVAKRRGVRLSTSISGAKSVALVVRTKQKYGAVQVRLDGRRIGRVSLKGAAGSQQVVLVRSFDAPASGKLTLVTRNGKKVVVDGVLVVSAS